MAVVGIGEILVTPSMKDFQRDVGSEVAGLEKSGPVKKAGGKFGKALQTAAKVGLAGGAVAIGTALTKGFGRLKSIEQAQATLTGLGHSAQSVELIMQNTNAAVKGTAFGLGDAATVAAQLVASGIKPGQDLQKTLTLVGDSATIAGVGIDQMGAIFAKAAASNKVQMDIIGQLHDAGVPALQLIAKEMGVTAEEASTMASKGEVDFATFEKAMTQGMGGAAQESGKTLSGAFDNSMAAVGRFGANLIQDVYPQLTTFFNAFQGWMGPVEELGKVIGKQLGDALRNTTTFITDTLVPAIQAIPGWLEENKTAITVTASVITALMIPVLIKWGIQATTAGVKNVAAFVMAKVEAIKTAAVFVAQSYKMIGQWIAMGAAALKSAAQTVYVWALYKIEAAKAVAAMVATKVKIVAQWVAMSAAAVASGIKTAAVWTGTIVRQAVVSTGAFMVQVGRTVAGWVLMGAQSLLQAGRMAAAWFIAMGPIGWAIAAIVGIAAIVIANWDKIKKWTIDTWNTISGKIRDVWNNNIKPVFQAFGNFIENTVKPAFQRGVDGIKKIWDTVKSIAYKPVDFVVNTVYNDGLRAMVNGMSDKLGLKWELPRVNIPAFAKGGQMKDGWKLVGEEGPELINTGPGYVYTANETKKMLAGQSQMPKGALDQGEQSHEGIGGFWSNLWGGVKSTVGKVKDWAVGMLAAGVRAVTEPLKNSISAFIPGGGFNELIRGAGFKVIDSLTGWATGMDDKHAPDGGAMFYDGPLGSFAKPANGPITSGFGASRGRYPHAGIDFAVGIGSAVRAMLNGVVRKVGWNAVTGRTGKGMVVDHANNLSSYYGHLSDWGKKPGDQVQAGERIASSGNTGRSTGPHLHAELWNGGKPFNFMSYLYDSGGVLPTGLRMIANASNKPEAILSNSQWKNMSTLANQAAQNMNTGTDAEALRYAMNGMTIKMQTESGTVFAKLVNKGLGDMRKKPIY